MKLKCLLLACGVSLLVPNTVEAMPKMTAVDVLVNKQHVISPINYMPPDLAFPQVLLVRQPSPEMELRAPAATALTNMLTAAGHQGMEIVLSSGYRSYESQSKVYKSALETDINARELVAKPGHSEHQTGLAADLVVANYFCAVQDCFAMTRAAAWLHDNSYHYGFIIRYPLGKELVTGYEYEPWHVRYVGVPLARKLHATNQTLDEYFRD